VQVAHVTLGATVITIEIWSDVNCPFCYIGKRHMERALEKFDKPVEVTWKSFELDPSSHPPKGSNNTERLAMKYGRDLKWAQEMNRNMAKMAKLAGLDFDVDHIVPANSFNAHRLIHLAKTKGLQDKMKERFLKAKFVEAKDINDPEILNSCAQEVGLNDQEVSDLLSSQKFEEDVRRDEEQASALGIHGVPFFVINKQYALSGAQPPESFLEVLNEASKEN
jgi:predicted DsbA family dithiol-disulfide isomerase